MTHDAFTLAWRRAAPSVSRVLSAHASYRSVDDREDLLQDVCVRAFRNMEAVEEERFVAWCCRIAERICVDANRRDACRARTTSLHEEVRSEADGETRVPALAIDAVTQDRDGQEILSRFAGLTRLQLETLVLRSEGLSYDEIGVVQGSSAGAARSGMNRVRVEAAVVLGRRREGAKRSRETGARLSMPEEALSDRSLAPRRRPPGRAVRG